MTVSDLRILIEGMLFKQARRAHSIKSYLLFLMFEVTWDSFRQELHQHPPACFLGDLQLHFPQEF